MSETVVSALPGAAYTDGPVQVWETGLRGMVTVKGDLASDTLRTAVTQVSGTNFPEPRQVRQGDGRALLWMAPDEVMILLPHDAAEAEARKIDAALGARGLAVNVSDARVVFRIAGPGLREVLAKLTPADMSTVAFGQGEVRRTRLAQVPAAFWLVGEAEADLVAFRSVAAYVFDLLVNAASAPDQPDVF